MDKEIKLGELQEIIVPLTKANILSKVSQEEIFRHFLGFDFVIRQKFCSPIRKDNTPSCSLFYASTRNLYMKDFTTNKNTGCFDLVMKMYGCDFKGALHIINTQMRLGLGMNSTMSKSLKPIRYDNYKHPQKDGESTLIQFIPIPYTAATYGYWKSYGISMSTLKEYNVFSVKRLFINKREVWRSLPGDPIFVYYFPGANRVKAYRPLTADKKRKWLASGGIWDIQGIEQLDPEGDLLIVTKSLKDVMVLRELGYNSIAPQGEGMLLPDSIVDFLYASYDNMIVLYDNDAAGRKGGTAMSNLLGCKTIEIPEESGIKDISDYAKKFGLTKAGTLIKQLLNE